MPKLISGKTKGFVRRNLASLDLLGVNLLLPFVLNRQVVSSFLSQRHAFTATYGCVRINYKTKNLIILCP